MKTRRGRVSARGPALPLVVQEITEKLLGDDWYRLSTQDGARWYYVVGRAEQGADLQQEADFSHLQFPIPTITGPIAEWAIRSQLANNEKVSFLANARRHLEKAGVHSQAIGRFLAGDVDAMTYWEFHSDVPYVERVKLLSNFCQAARLSLSDTGDIELDSDEANEAKVAREKICLRELAAKYLKVVDRWEQFERLPFKDSQLEEASRTFLYGFYRATVVLCASAVETQLKWLLPSTPERAKVFELIERAKNEKLIPADAVDYCKDLFSYRNRVAHDDADPQHDKAKEVLGVARMLVGKLRSV